MNTSEEIDPTDTTLFEALETENFEKLKEMQLTSEIKSTQKYFIEKLRKVFIKKGELFDNSSSFSQLLEQCEDRLRDMIVNVSDFSIGKQLSFGGQGVVNRGTYKFVEVAIKRITLETLSPKQLVR
jgi:hypothetical protein